MTRDHRVFRAYLNETGEIWESPALQWVYSAALRGMKAWAHINLGGSYITHIYEVDDRIPCGKEDTDECVLTVMVDAGMSWTEAEAVKGYAKEDDA